MQWTATQILVGTELTVSRTHAHTHAHTYIYTLRAATRFVGGMRKMLMLQLEKMLQFGSN